MQLTGPDVDDYAGDIAELLERYGVALTSPAPRAAVEVLEAADSSLSFELAGSLPDGRAPARSRLVVREHFRRVANDRFERDRYEYELVDRERSFRRAFHLHDPEWFQRYLVLVHEHCEQPLGTATCAHHHGTPIRDGFAGVLALMDAWTGDPTCVGLRCLD
ncbi:MAG TPA: hypothetical protein VJ850_05720 [Candidatus Limnocylindrales bacterium]|nr:hypothetical protein [Candidatus Limnocylindrales bacterium]